MFERFTKSARTAVVMAQEEARELGSEQIGVTHLLLGLTWRAEGGLGELFDQTGLTSAVVRAAIGKDDPLGEEDAEALRSIGIDLDAVRESLEATFGEDALDHEPGQTRGSRLGRGFGNHIPFTRDAKKILELSLREAVARKDDHIGAEHVLLGIVRSPADAQEVIEAHVALPELRLRVELILHSAA